jgi:hypothetical protein
MNIWKICSARPLAAIVAGLLLGFSPPAAADEFTDVVKEVLELYEAGEISEAKDALKYAEQLLAERESKAVGDLFPEALNGWTVSEAQGGAMAGISVLGGFTVARKYAGDGQDLTITLAGDSPMIQQFAMMFSNPSILQSTGGRLMRINRQKVIITKDGQIQTLVAKRFLIMIEGTADEETKLDHLKRFNLKGLSKLP